MIVVNNYTSAFYRMHRCFYQDDIQSSRFVVPVPGMKNAEIDFIKMTYFRMRLLKAGEEMCLGINNGDELKDDYYVWFTVREPDVTGGNIFICFYFSPEQNAFEVRNRSAKGIKSGDPLFVKAFSYACAVVFNACLSFEEEDDREIAL